jgi:hypothetical protein
VKQLSRYFTYQIYRTFNIKIDPLSFGWFILEEKLSINLSNFLEDVQNFLKIAIIEMN